MLSDPRTISLIAELLHIPAVHSPERLREVYNEVCLACDYENFTRVPGGARIERKEAEGEGFSVLSFLGDRIQVTEDHTGVTVEQFARKVHAVLEIALPRLGIPIILLHNATVRVASTPNSYKSAPELLARSVFKLTPEDVEPLRRPVNVFGFRLMFPPTQEDPRSFNVRVETYVRDQRSLYIENVGTFKHPVQPGEIDKVDRSLHATSEFIAENVIPFLSRYDRKVDES